ncbi:hypothetical protein Hanom_Chr09g00841361 [Helianthus anomalus]
MKDVMMEAPLFWVCDECSIKRLKHLPPKKRITLQMSSSYTKRS